jgi:hypothetical protein
MPSLRASPGRRSKRGAWCASTFAGLLALLGHGTIGGCTKSSTSAKSAIGVSDATSRLENTLAGNPDPTSVEAGSALTQAMSPAELAYLEGLDWTAVGSGQAFLADPILRKALVVVVRRFPDQGAMSMVDAPIEIGIAHAQSDPCGPVNSGVSSVLGAIRNILGGATLGGACLVGGATGVGLAICAGAAILVIYNGVATFEVGPIAAALDQFVAADCDSPAQSVDPTSAQQDTANDPDPNPTVHPPDPGAGCPSGQAHEGCGGACVPYGSGCDDCGGPCPNGMACTNGLCLSPPRCAGRCDNTDGHGGVCPPFQCPGEYVCSSGECVRPPSQDAGAQDSGAQDSGARDSSACDASCGCNPVGTWTVTLPAVTCGQCSASGGPATISFTASAGGTLTDSYGNAWQFDPVQCTATIASPASANCVGQDTLDFASGKASSTLACSGGSTCLTCPLSGTITPVAGDGGM